MGLCTQADVESHVPPEQLARPARLLSTASATTDVITLDGHGCQTDDPVTLRAESGGSMPSPLVAGTTYYAIRLTDSTLQLAAAAGGTAIDITTAGSNTVLIRQIPWDRAITWATAIVEDSLGAASAVALTAPYPQIVIETTAELAAAWLRRWAGTASNALTQTLDWAQAQLDRWRKGVPVRGANAPTSANNAIRASVSVVDSRGWSRTEGSIP